MENLKQRIKNKSAIISVIGLGYVGLPTAVYFAEKGFKVYGVDNLVPSYFKTRLDFLMLTTKRDIITKDVYSYLLLK